MSTKKTYFLAPTRHSTPLGAICLGNIIEKPKEPEFMINDPSSDAITKLVAKANQIDETDSFNYITQASNFRTNIFASLLEGLGNVGAGAGLNSSSDISSIYRIEKLITQTISPSFSDIKEVFNEPAVQDAIKNSMFRGNVYMITSIRVAYGAEVFASTVKEAGGFLHMRADLTPAGAPVNVGAAIEAANKKGQILATHVSNKTPFVLAYRVRELVYQRKTIKKQKEVEGEIMHADGDGHDKVGRKEDDSSDYTAELCEIEDEDDELPDILGMKIVPSADLDNSECQIAITST